LVVTLLSVSPGVPLDMSSSITMSFPVFNEGSNKAFAFILNLFVVQVQSLLDVPMRFFPLSFYWEFFFLILIFFVSNFFSTSITVISSTGLIISLSWGKFDSYVVLLILFLVYICLISETLYFLMTGANSCPKVFSSCKVDFFLNDLVSLVTNEALIFVVKCFFDEMISFF
jgi:hypothetical protein